MATAPAAATFMNHLSSQEPRTMTTTKSVLAAAITLASFAASAQVSTAGSVVTAELKRTSSDPSWVTLSSANFVGGAIYTEPQTFDYAARPTNGSPSIITRGRWGAVGGSSNNINNGGGSSAAFTPVSGAQWVSFLWGSPDPYNTLTVNTNAGSQSFTAAALGLTATGDRNQASYVTFRVTGAATAITSLRFDSAQQAFEFSNINAAVPEPGTYAMLLSGLLGVGFVARRRRAQTAGQPTPALG
jgi:hypothetical protein